MKGMCTEIISRISQLGAEKLNIKMDRAIEYFRCFKKIVKLQKCSIFKLNSLKLKTINNKIINI